jgi:hypothetical protein
MIITDEIFDQIMDIRASGQVNMFSAREVTEIALQKNYLELCELLETNLSAYSNFILTGERK